MMPVWLLTAWPWIKKALPYLGGIALVLAAYWWADNRGRTAQKAKDTAQITALNQTIADVRNATAKAQADDAAHKKAVETAQNQITETSNATLENQLAAARADAAAYAQRLRQQSQAGAGAGGGRSAPVPESTDATGSTDGTGQTPELDATACAEAVTKAQGWQDWWKGVAAVPR